MSKMAHTGSISTLVSKIRDAEDARRCKKMQEDARRFYSELRTR
jgi:hypothetical protein